MPDNYQELPSGLLFSPYLDFETIETSFSTDEAQTYSILQDDGFIKEPIVYIDGLLLTNDVNTTRRYTDYDFETKTLYIRNGIVQLGEYVQIFL